MHWLILDNNEFACGVVLDICKAFDIVSHKILITKLKRYGLTGIVLDWWKSYLEKRTQQASIKGITFGSSLQ